MGNELLDAIFDSYTYFPFHSHKIFINTQAIIVYQSEKITHQGNKILGKSTN